MSIFVLAEKPSAAKKIAEALAEKRPKKLKKRGVEYYELLRNGKRHYVVPAVGHLFRLAPSGRRWEYPVFDVEWKERHLVDRYGKFTEAHLENIKDLAREANAFINSCDYDIEGSTLAYNILKMACGAEDAKRMKFSTLVKEDLVQAYEDASPSLDWGLVNAGLTRHYLDFYWGVNLSRALTIALNKAARLGFKVLSTGRVQAPTLALLTKREKEIEAFKPTPFWQIKIEVLVDGIRIEGWFEEEKIWKKEEAQGVLDGCKGKEAEVSAVLRRKYRHRPPTPFNLTDLQVESYRLFGYTPDRTLGIAQNLYEMAAISYPRTASQKLPPQIGYRNILTALSSLSRYKKLTGELLKEATLKPLQGKRTDPAHVAIYPTREVVKRKIRPDQSKLYDLIVRRFMATFGTPAVRETLKIELKVGDHTFFLTGRRTIEENWYRFYGPYVKLEETVLPDLKEGDVLKVDKVELMEKQTQPPDRYTPASIVRKLEESGLGTKATRSGIVKTLFDRGYVSGRSIKVTALGKGVVGTLNKYCPKILSAKLTREFEDKMEQVQEGKAKRDDVLEESREILEDVLYDFQRKEKEIGKDLAKELKKAERVTLGTCPSCKVGTLTVIYSRRTRKRFVGCSQYFEGKKCTYSAPLPQRGSLQSLDRSCKVCGYPMVMVKARGSRPWRLCINTDCPAKKARKAGASKTAKPAE